MFEILQELTKSDTEQIEKWAKAVGRMVPIDLLPAGLPQTFDLWQFWSATSQSIIKQICLHFLCNDNKNTLNKYGILQFMKHFKFFPDI